MDKGKDGGFFLYGKVESGTLLYNRNYILMPGGKRFQIPIIFNAKEEPVPYAKDGENIKVKSFLSLGKFTQR